MQECCELHVTTTSCLEGFGLKSIVKIFFLTKQLSQEVIYTFPHFATETCGRVKTNALSVSLHSTVTHQAHRTKVFESFYFRRFHNM